MFKSYYFLYVWVEVKKVLYTSMSALNYFVGRHQELCLIVFA